MALGIATAFSVATLTGLSSQAIPVGAAALIASWALGRRRALQSIRADAHALARQLSAAIESTPARNAPCSDPLFELSLAAQAATERMSIHNVELQILQEAIEGINEGVVLIGVDRKITYVNRAFSVQTELSRSDAIGRDYLSILKGPDNAPLSDKIWSAVDHDRTWSGDAQWALPGAWEQSLTVRISAVRADGRVSSYVALHRDTSALQELEDEQRIFARNLLRVHRIGQRVVETLDIDQLPERLVKGVADGFKMTTRLWFLSETGLSVNRVAQAGPRGAACAQTVKIGECLPGIAAVHSNRLVISATSVDQEMLLHETDLPSGIERHHVAYPLRKGGELLAVLEVSADGALHGRPLETLRLLAQVAAEAISNARLHQHTAAQAASLEMLSHQLIDAHQAEQATRQEVEELNEKLMGADQLKNQLLNTTSHELRTPLSSILGYLDLILDEHAESVAEEREFVGEARRCAEHLLHLINDILDISRIEAGNLSIVPGSVDIHALMDDVRSTIAPQARQKNIELHVQCHDELLALADFRRARQALLNLTANAVKFTEKGSVALTAHDNGDAIQITVSDTGIGVSEADRANVFEPFFQSDSSNNRAYPGTGLGLAITKRLVQLMGGEVRLEERQAAVGSAFSMTLPKNVISEIRQPTRGGVS